MDVISFKTIFYISIIILRLSLSRHYLSNYNFFDTKYEKTVCKQNNKWISEYYYLIQRFAFRLGHM